MTSSNVPESLEDAIYTVVHDGALEPKQLAAATGIRPGYLLDAANPHREDTQFQARFIVPVTKAQRNDAIVRFLCSAVGGVFVRLNAAADADEHTSRSLKEFGDYLHSVAESNSDGRVTPAEAAHVKAQGHEAIAAILAHIAHVEQRVEQPTPRPMEVRSMAR
jgi:hypothetical protein